jgi:hypothetical protein
LSVYSVDTAAANLDHETASILDLARAFVEEKLGKDNELTIWPHERMYEVYAVGPEESRECSVCRATGRVHLQDDPLARIADLLRRGADAAEDDNWKHITLAAEMRALADTLSGA